MYQLLTVILTGTCGRESRQDTWAWMLLSSSLGQAAYYSTVALSRHPWLAEVCRKSVHRGRGDDRKDKTKKNGYGDHCMLFWSEIVPIWRSERNVGLGAGPVFPANTKIPRNPSLTSLLAQALA